MRYFKLIIRLVVAVILLQTLFFKFTAAPESVFIFSKLGLEPVGRIGTGIAELITGILLLIPGTVFIGALLSVGIISGAIFSHLTVLGIVVQNDGGLLFGMAVIVFIGSILLLYLYRNDGLALYKKLMPNEKMKTTA